MNVQVHTYSQPKEWKRHPVYASFPGAIHICATNNQESGIRSCYGGELQHVYSFRKFIKALYASWYSPETTFQQFLRLSRIIAGFGQLQPELRRSFRANAMEVLDTIRFFTQANVWPHHLRDSWLKTEKERAFQAVWAKFAEEDEAVREHYEKLEKAISRDDLQQAIRALRGGNVSLDEDIHLVLHGFYFVTPEQQIVLEILRKQGLRITFFQYYDGRYAETFDFIKAFVTDRFGWPSPEQWVYDAVANQAGTGIADTFLSAYEKRPVQPLAAKKEVTAYPSFFDFLHDVILPHFPIGGGEQRPVNIIAPNEKQLNELLLSYYPELNHKKRNFLSYPIGRFLVGLHEIYNNGQLHMTEENLSELFSSGWLYDEFTREHAQDYTYDLQQLFPYLQGCGELSTWVSRLEQLIVQGLGMEKAFPAGRENRIVRSMRSPFAKIGHFAVPLDRVKQVKRFMEMIHSMAHSLFEKSDSSNIHLHFKRLQGILRKHGKGVALIANENEKLLIQELGQKLQYIQDDSEFLYTDLQTALHFYLSGKLDDRDEEHITSFIEIDGEMFKPQDHTIYLTGLDEQSLPLGAQGVPWPLQAETFEKLSEEHVALELHTIRSRANKLISRYLFFIALNLPQEQLRLSWIKNMVNQENLQPALYIKQLGLEVKSEPDSSRHTEAAYMPYDFSEEESSKEDKVEAMKTLAFEDFLAEYVQCPRRFYYSYLTEEYPVFSSDFMHQFLFSEIVKVAGQGSGARFEKVLKEMGQLFPQWLPFKRYVAAKTSFTYVPRQLGKKTEVDDAHAYTETRKNFQFPGMKKVARDKLFGDTKAAFPDVVREILLGEQTEMRANPGYECRFCPHVSYCSEAVQAVDLGKEDN
ncbi:hypothetical protein [Ectobacillus ponti]|uniref:Uncharacterized protein n=1 Tax=Ectobacillus ponti TaxID=2961894 RepID=A0AA41X8V7_9BACI|nr:hypothetical protein [Ectobacillus ponti]MCP8970937.1 hypothetical protein [Ectobacillus ponti]